MIKIGVVIMLAEIKALGRAMTFAEIQSLARLAEQLGFDSIWVYDHLLYRFKPGKTTGIWEGWSMLSALAASTQRVELGTLVACNSFRNPALLAKMAHTVDEISGGRLILGLGAGWNEPEYRAFGFPFDHRVARFEEALQIVRPLLKEGRVDFQGKYYQACDCEITPRSTRPEGPHRPAQTGPPLLVGAFGPRMLRLTARYADLWNFGYLTLPRGLEKPRRALERACKEIGRDPASLPSTVMISLSWPELLGWKQPKKRGTLTGSAGEIAEIIAEYERMGAVHLMFHMNPASAAGFEKLAEAVNIYRSW